MAKKKTEDENTEKGAKDGAQASGDGSAGDSGGTEGANGSSKKRKLILIAGIGGVGLAAASVGGFFVMKTLSTPHEMKAQELADPNAAGNSSEAPSGASEETAAKTDPKSKEGEHKEGEQKEASAPKSSGAPEDGAHSSGTETGAKKKTDKAEASTDPNAFGDTLEIPKMELNLGNPLENRFLRFGLSIEYHGGEEQHNDLTRRMPQIRDIVITLIAKKSRLELLSANGKEAFRKQLKNSLNELLEKPITNVYFTEFLVE